MIVEPEKIGDKEADILASDIAAKIKETMEYPGQIKVCVIRQTVSSKITDEFSNEFPDGDNNHDHTSNHTETVTEN